jgi:ATP-dependent RNA helicase DHX8/PRP22
MKECDQYNGGDLNPERTKQLQTESAKPDGITKDSKPQLSTTTANSKFGAITGILVETADAQGEKRKRIASPDLWEYTRLQGGNVLNLIDDANLRIM